MAELYPDEHVRGGLGEHLAAVHELVDRFEVGEAEAPEGVALVLAAADYARAGVDRAVSTQDLSILMPCYLNRLRPLRADSSNIDLDEAIKWATEPIGRTAALLVAEKDTKADLFRIDDSIVDYIERRYGRELFSSEAWHLIAGHIPPRDRLAVAGMASSRNAVEFARTTYEELTNSDDLDRAAMAGAAVSLGQLLLWRTVDRDLDSAQRAFQMAVDYSDSEEERADNEFFLAGVLDMQGDHQGACEAYRHTLEHGGEILRCAAGLNLGALLGRQGDVAGRQLAYQRAVDTATSANRPLPAPLANVATVAAFRLANLLAEQEEIDGARIAYEHAIEFGLADVDGIQELRTDDAELTSKADYVAMAATELGRLEREEGEKEKAIIAFQLAYRILDEEKRYDPGSKVALELAMAMREMQDIAASRGPLEYAAKHGNAEVAGLAAFLLIGTVDERSNLPTGTVDERSNAASVRIGYEKAAAAGVETFSAIASFNLGILLEKQGDLTGAQKAYQRVVDDQNESVAIRGSFNLGLLLKSQGEFEPAKVALNRVFTSTDSSRSAHAGLEIGRMERDEGDLDAARSTFKRVIEFGDLHTSAMAKYYLQEMESPPEKVRRWTRILNPFGRIGSRQ